MSLSQYALGMFLGERCYKVNLIIEPSQNPLISAVKINLPMQHMVLLLFHTFIVDRQN